MARAVVVVSVALLACNYEAPPPASTPGSATVVVDDEGAKTYSLFCAPCHGADAKGYKADHAPSLINPTFLESAKDTFLIEAIGQGRPGTSMAAYGKTSGGPLEPAKIAKVVAWLRAQGPAVRPLEWVDTIGDAARGQPIYASMCLKCHGTRDVRGEFVSLSNPRFLATASDAFMNHAIVYGRPSTQMVAWQGKLSAQDIADVIAYVRSLQQTLSVTRMPAPTGGEPLFVNPHGKPPSWKGRADPCPANTACKPDPRFVAADLVKAALDQHQKLVIIDARLDSEWMMVHITGAVSIPYSDMKRLAEIPKDAWIVAYCACPHHLSGIVVDELQRRGYTHAFVLDEGINVWQTRGYPVVAAPGVAPPPAEPTHMGAPR
jgi:rhodanese-related sulfurtransferase/mono/diheme cytochrome c family protein